MVIVAGDWMRSGSYRSNSWTRRGSSLMVDCRDVADEVEARTMVVVFCGSSTDG